MVAPVFLPGCFLAFLLVCLFLVEMISMTTRQEKIDLAEKEYNKVRDTAKDD